MAAPNFAGRVWIAFDPPSSTSPTWIEISGFVDQESTINISHGRGDGLSDPSASTCSLTVDNDDGRFSPANPAGAWFGQIHKSNWLKVELTPPSTTVSQRFVGFITSLPNQWSGESQFGQITASDRFEKLGQSPAIVSSIQSEVLTDPNLAGSVKSYWNLHEATGSLTFGDTSGQGARHLLATGAGGVPAGIGFGASNAAGPGFDGLRAVAFNPVSTTQGTYLTAPVVSPTGSWNFATTTYTGLYPTLEFWFQATTTGVDQILASIIDPVGQFAFTITLGANGYINWAAILVAFGAGGLVGNGAVTNFRIDDGQWHHVLFAGAASSNSFGWFVGNIFVDGVSAYLYFSGGTNPVGTGAFTQLTIGGGIQSLNPGRITLGASNIAEVAWYWGDINRPVVPTFPGPNLVDHFTAGRYGFASESTDHRVARIARYAGVPIPLTTIQQTPAIPTLANQVYAGTSGPWTNLSPGAHLCGTQSVAGRKPLDIMLEAAHTEGMPLYVNRAGYLEMQPSTTRQNTSPAWSVNAIDLDPGTQVADDFAYVTNQITVTPNGQAAQTVIGVPGFAASAGPLSQAKFGVYDGSQSTASVNPIEAQSLGLGIIQIRADPAPRLAPIALEVSTAALMPGYGSAWYDSVLATEISTPVRVTNAPAAIGGGTYDCLVEGWNEAITAGQHMMQFNISPVQGPTYQLDDVVFGHLDTDGTSLTAGVTTTTTTLNIAVVSNTSAAWTTNSADFPFDVLVDTERMTASAVTPVALGVDGTFETSATGWTLSNCTLVQSTAQAHTGTHSGLLTASAAGAFTATTPQFAVNANATYQVSQWFRLASGAPTGETVAVRWFTSGGASLGQVILPNLFTPTASWQQQQLSTLTAPATAAFATVGIGATAAAIGNAMYIDDVTFPLLLGGQQQMTVTRSVNGVVATHLSGAALALATPLTLAY